MHESVNYGRPLQLREHWLCLEFCNATMDWRASTAPIELLNHYADLTAWGRQVGLLTETEAAHLDREAAAAPRAAAGALKRARRLREICYRIFSAIGHRRVPEQPDIDGLNRALAAGLGDAAIAARPGGFVWSWQQRPLGLDWLLWPLARSAADLLTSADLKRVGECADDRGCGWLFVDTSRGGKRRWCSMKSCGNRAKAQRHYRRKI